MVKISADKLVIARSNGITRATVYRRVNDRGWSIEDAITIPTDPLKESRRQQSKFYGLERGKKAFSTKMPLDYEGINWEEKLNAAIAKSGLTSVDYIAEALVEYLKIKNQ